jgi:hypothetical protein
VETEVPVIMRGIVILGLFALGLQTASFAAPLRVDLSMPGRPDSLAPDWENWQINAAPSASRVFGGVSVTFTKVGPEGIGIESGWWKEGANVHGALVASDGIAVQNGDDGGQIEMRIAGLTAGPHTLVTYHNTWHNPANNTFSDIHVSLDGVRIVTGLTPSNRVTNDFDAQRVLYDLDAEAGEDVVILFEADTTDASASLKNVPINAFEIDTSNPEKKAIDPFPAQGDEHVDGDDGDVTLTWDTLTPAASFDVYFGTSEGEVSGAEPSSSFIGNTTTLATVVGELDHMETYYWRVDAVDDGGTRTIGDVWRFRIRHLAFPTAEGWGRFARGGRGGVVYEVTNLNDSGPGSLRAGIEASGPRTIVFRVSGLITLESKLVLRNAYCTVAGQTAPGDGICLRKYNFGLLGMDDAIIRYVRVRPGNISGDTLDGMGMASSDHAIVDHCSISWTIDESFSSRQAKNITLQRTLISEALNQAGHSNYPPGTRHGYAASIGGDKGSFHHNLLAHCYGRNWSLAGGLDGGNVHTGSLDIRNNVVYNWGSRTTDGGAKEVNFVRNYYRPGPGTNNPFTELNPQYENPGFGPQQYYVEGNVMIGRHGPEGPLPPFQGVDPQGTQPWPVTLPDPFFEHYVVTHTAAEAFENVLADVGCNRPTLDAHDLRVIDETRNGTFTYRGGETNIPGMPDSQADVGGWDTYPVMVRPVEYDSDHDGMPDDWETKHGLDPDDPADRNDVGERGYTQLEIYLNYLAGDIEEPAVETGIPAGVWTRY